jgi:hypothetical protein
MPQISPCEEGSVRIDSELRTIPGFNTPFVNKLMTLVQRVVSNKEAQHRVYLRKWNKRKLAIFREQKALHS